MTGIVASAVGFGFVFGLTARGAGFSVVEATAFSVIVFAGASQFAAVGMVAAGFGWPAIVLLTGLVNARHALYAAALAPWLRGRPRPERALMAHVLTDEAFALSLVHFRRLGLADRRGYWLAAIGGVFIPWNLATLAGYLGGQAVPDPRLLGLDIVFPAAMAGLAVGLTTGRREAVALGAGVVVALAVALAVDPRVGVVAGGLLGPAVGLAVPRRDRNVPEPDELPADPGAFSRPDRSEDGMLP
ncbi:MAG TPA: AzlC family ABC transporter permease [Candidatus Nanopelagicales bacterium]|nr:AzlC family ABC transporter permease [Candidatus Nanopelagicales bacterium]